jgi:hypothetical protein
MQAVNMNTLELQQLQQKFNALPKQLVSAAGNMDIVLSMAAEATTVPLNEIIPMGNTDKDAFACLRQIRHDFTGRLIIFRNVLLPVSKDVVNGLLTFLDYMEDKKGFLSWQRRERSAVCAASTRIRPSPCRRATRRWLRTWSGWAKRWMSSSRR